MARRSTISSPDAGGSVAEWPARRQAVRFRSGNPGRIQTASAPVVRAAAWECRWPHPGRLVAEPGLRGRWPWLVLSGFREVCVGAMSDLGARACRCLQDRPSRHGRRPRRDRHGGRAARAASHTGLPRCQPAFRGAWGGASRVDPHRARPRQVRLLPRLRPDAAVLRPQVGAVRHQGGRMTDPEPAIDPASSRARGIARRHAASNARQGESHPDGPVHSFVISSERLNPVSTVDTFLSCTARGGSHPPP